MLGGPFEDVQVAFETSFWSRLELPDGVPATELTGRQASVSLDPQSTSLSILLDGTSTPCRGLVDELDREMCVASVISLESSSPPHEVSPVSLTFHASEEPLSGS